MPPSKKKQLVWKCRKCEEIVTADNNDREIMKESGFTHQLESHELVEENRRWFDTHIQNYYDIT